MDIMIFLKTHQNKNYDELKQIFENNYNIKVNLNINKDYFMLLCTDKSDLKKKIVRQCSGTIVDIKTKSILYYFGEKAYQNNLINDGYLIDKFFIEPYIDGIIIKIFRHNNKWKMATSKHTNIKMVKVNNNTLYNIFENTIKRLFNSMKNFFKDLDKEYCYTYLLINEQDKYNIKLINKVCLKTFDQKFNMKDSIPFIDFINLNILNKNNFSKYILTKIDDYEIKRIHIDKPILEMYIYKYKTINYSNN